MIKKIKTLIISLSLALGLAAPLAVPAVASAAFTSNNVTNGVCDGITDATGNAGTGCTTTSGDPNDTLKRVAKTIINVFSVIVGIVAVIMVIYGGFRYITSGGDSGKVGNAKNTLIYAIIGLVIVALAQFLVHFVLTTSVQSV